MFSSKENKQMIWNLLLSQMGASINNTRFMALFEKNVQYIDTNHDKFSTLVDMNKELLSLSLNSISSHNQPSKPIHMKKLYDKALAEKQKQIKSMKDGQKPPDIDFSDSNSTQFETVDHLVAKSQEQRARELESITTSYKTEQAKTDDNAVPKLTIHDFDPSKKNNIESSKKNNIESSKKVSFNLEKQKSNICVKISYTENDINKTIICQLSNGFRVFMSPHGNNNNQTTAVLEHIELLTK